MSNERGYYYLHNDGNLIYKRDYDGGQVADFRESDLVKMFWPIGNHPSEFWGMLVEATVCGASSERISELRQKWGINDESAVYYLEYLGLNSDVDGNAKMVKFPDFTNIQESPCGFGDDIFEALVDLCKHLKYQPSKMWGASFEKLVISHNEIKEGAKNENN